MHAVTVLGDVLEDGKVVVVIILINYHAVQLAVIHFAGVIDWVSGMGE
jgi:hypothetical protein